MQHRVLRERRCSSAARCCERYEKCQKVHGADLEARSFPPPPPSAMRCERAQGIGICLRHCENLSRLRSTQTLMQSCTPMQSCSRVVGQLRGLPLACTYTIRIMMVEHLFILAHAYMAHKGNRLLASLPNLSFTRSCRPNCSPKTPLSVDL